MTDLKPISQQTQQGVTFAVTRIYKSLDFDYSPDLKPELPPRKDDFNGLFEFHHPSEQLIIKIAVSSENEDFHISPRYIGCCDITDNLGNQFWHRGWGHTSDAEKVKGFAYFDYTHGAESITLRHKIANRCEDDCGVILFEDVKLDETGVVKSLNGKTITYNSVLPPENGKPHGICIQLSERANSQYIGVTHVTDNLSNAYHVKGVGWRRSEKPATEAHQGDLWVSEEEIFYLDKPLAPEATSINFRYLIAKTVLDFELPNLPLPS